MKKNTTKFAVLALALLMVFGIMPMASASTPPAANMEVNRTADIKFKGGEIEVVPPDPGQEDETGFTAFKLEFGQRPLPIRPEIYVSDGTSGTPTSSGGVTSEGAALSGTFTDDEVGVLVTDPRSTTTAWSLQVAMTKFEDSATTEPSFDAELALVNGSKYSTALASRVATELTIANTTQDFSAAGSAENGIFIRTDEIAVNVLSSTVDLGHGNHGVHWANENIRLKLQEQNALNTGFDVITETTYQSVLTWTLLP